MDGIEPLTLAFVTIFYLGPFRRAPASFWNKPLEFHCQFMSIVIFGLALRFLYFVFRFYIGFNSVVVATCRTCLLVYENHITNFGLNKFKIILYYGSITIPILIVLLAEATIPIQNYDKYLATEKAWCKHSISDIDNLSETSQSPIYSFTQKYVNPNLIVGVEIFCYFIGFLSLSNIIEGILYLHAWTYIIR